jgi:hypothetical protein
MDKEAAVAEFYQGSTAGILPNLLLHNKPPFVRCVLLSCRHCNKHLAQKVSHLILTIAQRQNNSKYIIALILCQMLFYSQRPYDAGTVTLTLQMRN